MNNATPEQRVNQFLEAIGLRDDDGEYLASINIVNNDRIELYLHTSPEDAARKIEQKTGMKADFEYNSEGAYWNYSMGKLGFFYLERYHSGSLYMTIVNGDE